MKTFEQHYSDTTAELPSNGKIYKFLVKTLTAEPFRFKENAMLNYLFKLKREIKYTPHYITAKYRSPERVYNHNDHRVGIDIPYIDSQIFAEFMNIPTIKKIVSNTINKYDENDPWYFSINEDMDISVNDIVEGNNNDWNVIKLWFEIYNVYEDTPGSSTEKVIAMGQFIGMSRIEILKIKQKYGLLSKDDELSDQETLDLF